MSNKGDFYDGSMLKPRKGPVREEVIIMVVLAGCAILPFGFQLLLRLVAECPQGDSLLTRLFLFHLPFHFWFTGQFLPLWFIVLCIFFNLCIDRLTELRNRNRDRSYE